MTVHVWEPADAEGGASIRGMIAEEGEEMDATDATMWYLIGCLRTELRIAASRRPEGGEHLCIPAERGRELLGELECICRSALKRARA